MILSFTFNKSKIYTKNKYILNQVWNKLQQHFEQVTGLATKTKALKILQNFTHNQTSSYEYFKQCKSQYWHTVVTNIYKR